MNVFQSFLIALDMLRTHKMRAFLTMLGVIIGVMSVTVIVMISSGFQTFMGSQFNKAGVNTIMVFFDPGRRERQTLGKTEGLRMEDLQFLKNRVSALDIVVPVMQVPSQKATFEDKNVDNARVYATDSNYFALNNLDLSIGRAFSAGDITARSNVCLVGKDIQDQLFGGKDPIGKFLTLPGITLEIIGVFDRTDFFGESNGRDVLLPVTTAQDKWLGTKDLMMIMTRPKSGITVDFAMDGVWQALMLKTGNRKLYRVDSNESLMKVFGAVFGVAGSVLAAIAALSLLVGGIGIMNIMLVSVTERTKEIGLRKAVGARSSSILMQFLVEAATLSLVGGLIGMGIAWMLGNGVSILTTVLDKPKGGLPTPFPLPAAIASALFSALIGVVFGLYPALAAAKLDPIVALRRE